MSSNLGAKKWASTGDLHQVLHDKNRWTRLQKYNDAFTKKVDRFHEAVSYIKSRLENSEIQVWADDFNEILDSCFSRVHKLSFDDFMRAVNSKMMNKVNDQMSEVLDIAITLESFIEDAIKEPKKPFIYKKSVKLH